MMKIKPRASPNFQNGAIYKIYCKDETITDYFIGRTTNLKATIATLRGRCNNPNNASYHRKYCEFIRNNGGVNNWSVCILQEYPTDNVHSLVRETQRLLLILKPSLNILDGYNPNKPNGYC